MTPEELREREEAKEELSGHIDPEERDPRLIVDGVDDESFGIDFLGRATIGDVVVTEPIEREFDEEENCWKSPAQLQAELGELPEWEEKPDLDPLYAEPCPDPDCGHITDLRDRTKTNVLGVAHMEGVPCLSWRCKCGQARVTDGRQLPPDLCAAGDETDELMDFLAEECRQAAAHKPY